MYKVISFGLWGSDLKYTKGALENLRLQKIYYKDYVCRFYTGNDVPENIINALKSKGCEIVPMGEPDKAKRYWRLKVIEDLTVDAFLIRDTDSRIGKKEVEAVRQWEKSERLAHCMYDHKRHTAAIMGGMWGMKKDDLIREPIIKQLNVWIDKVRGGYKPTPRIGKADGDQMFLKKVVWPEIKDFCLKHGRIGVAFPFAGDPIHFVGQVYDAHNKPQVKP
jgi:hypothetical protein